jgi:hypothetical protein
MGAVYLELQNVSDVGTPMEIYYDPHSAVACRLLDASENPIKSTPAPFSIELPFPYWIMLPHDSTLRFRISVSGYAHRTDEEGLFVGLALADWLIPLKHVSSVSLSASFSSSPKKTSRQVNVWQGVIRLPKLRMILTESNPGQNNQ